MIPPENIPKATYYGKTKCHFKVRICEHLGISYLTRKKVMIDFLFVLAHY